MLLGAARARAEAWRGRVEGFCGWVRWSLGVGRWVGVRCERERWRCRRLGDAADAVCLRARDARRGIVFDKLDMFSGCCLRW